MTSTSAARERYRRNIIRLSKAALHPLEDTDLKELPYFTNLLRRTFVSPGLDGTEYMGSYCVMVPDEIVYAFGYRSLRLCVEDIIRPPSWVTSWPCGMPVP